MEGSFYWTKPYVSEFVPGLDHNRGAPPPAAIPDLINLTMGSWVRRSK